MDKVMLWYYSQIILATQRANGFISWIGKGFTTEGTENREKSHWEARRGVLPLRI